MTKLRNNGVRRSEILNIIKKNGQSNVKEISQELGISHVAARQHLTKLAESNYVSIHTRPEHPGRPEHFFVLTEKGDEQFPRAYQTLVKELLSELSEWQGAETVGNLLTRRQLSNQCQFLNQLESNDNSCRVDTYCELMNDKGYMVSHEVESDRSCLLTFGNCVLSSIAIEYPLVCCQGEISLLESTDAATISECLQHRNQGDIVCKFRLRFSSTEILEEE